MKEADKPLDPKGEASDARGSAMQPFEPPPDWDEYAPLTDAQIDEMDAITKAFTPAMYDDLEGELKLYAAVRNWPGDPLKQPPQVVLAMARRIARTR